MIDLHTWSTPNGFKISIALEELALPYRVVPVDIGAGAQFQPEFLAISPNNKIPAIVDHDAAGGRPLAIFESAAILVYLAEKTGKLLSSEPAARYAALSWLSFQIGSVGPMFGQLGHFRAYAKEKIPYAIERYTNEVNRLYGVLDRQLSGHAYVAGEYSIADIALYPWVRGYGGQAVDPGAYPHVARWLGEVGARPAVAKGMTIPETKTRPMDDKARDVLFGKGQFERR